MKDDLFDIVGIEYGDIDAAMEQVLSAAYKKVQKVPEPYNKYYRVVSEQEIEEYALEEVLRC